MWARRTVDVELRAVAVHVGVVHVGQVVVVAALRAASVKDGGAVGGQGGGEGGGGRGGGGGVVVGGGDDGGVVQGGVAGLQVQAVGAVLLQGQVHRAQAVAQRPGQEVLCVHHVCMGEGGRERERERERER